MKRTSPITLILFAATGAAVGVALQVGLAQAGHPGLNLPLSLALVLSAIGVITVVLAWPVRKMVRGTGTAMVDPFYATRVVVLAKSGAIAGALLVGGAAGAVGYLLTRSVPPVGSVGLTIATLVGALLLMVCGLIAEHMCRLPPDDGDESRDKSPAEA